MRGIPRQLVVSGDFNAQAIEWGMPQITKQGRLLLEMVARLDLNVITEVPQLSKDQDTETRYLMSYLPMHK